MVTRVVATGWTRNVRPLILKGFAIGLLLSAGCRTSPIVGEREPRAGDEIMVAGQLFHTGTPIVLWTDPGGFDGYRVERRFGSWARAGWAESKADVPTLDTPNRYGLRAQSLLPEEIERVRGGGWDLPLLQRVVDQFVLHYDAVGVSRVTFAKLHDDRGLSVHFMLDLDGTIYQTLDLKERAWHATIANSRSIGIEIANIGAYAADHERNPLADWYATDTDGRTRLTIPERFGDQPERMAGFAGKPSRDEAITGSINGQSVRQYDFTPEQYAALIKLTAALCRIFPKMACDYPRDAAGHVITTTLPEAEWAEFGGVLGHFHIQTNKIDPGPAMDWNRLIDGARKEIARAERRGRKR